MVRTTQEVVRILLLNKETLIRFGVLRIGLFGSFLHDRADAESDVDLLVEFEPEQKSFENFSNLAFFLEECFGRGIEMVTPEGLSPYIGPHILREAEDVPIRS